MNFRAWAQATWRKISGAEFNEALCQHKRAMEKSEQHTKEVEHWATTTIVRTQSSVVELQKLSSNGNNGT